MFLLKKNSKRFSIQLVCPASGESTTRSCRLSLRQLFHSIGLPSECGVLHHTPYTAQDVQRPFARLLKITPQNSFNPAKQIAETLTQ